MSQTNSLSYKSSFSSKIPSSPDFKAKNYNQDQASRHILKNKSQTNDAVHEKECQKGKKASGNPICLS